MAYQLVYTSAPKLIQAGRTGFGTVARHPELKGSLQEEIERFSQFSRVEGMDPNRVIYSFRLFTVRSERFGVLSRIRDAGSDYTGRTNHIAHHIVLTSAEISTARCSPVDVILHLNNSSLWKDSWESGPAEFGSEQEIDILAIPSSLSLPAQYWQPAKCAALPASSKYHESCWIVHNGRTLDGGIPEMLPLLGEALLVTSNPWSYSFTTDLQPTERVDEVRWRGVAQGSPMVAQASQSVRPTIDLTNPALLAEPDAKLAALAEQGRREESTQRQFGHIRSTAISEGEGPSIIRTGGGQHKLSGDSLKFGGQNISAVESRPIPWVLVASGLLALLILAVVFVLFYRGARAEDHLAKLETSLSEGTAQMEEAISETNSDWIFIFGLPSKLDKATEAVSLYAKATTSWSLGNIDEALKQYEEAVEALPDGTLFSNTLRKGYNEHKMEAEILQAVARIKSGTIDAALLARDGRSSDIQQVLYWQQDHRKVPGLDSQSIDALQNVAGLKSSASKQFYEFKEAVREARGAAKGDDEVSRKVSIWINDQVMAYAKKVLGDPSFDGKTLGQFVNADLVLNDKQKKAFEVIQKVVMGIDAKPDRNRTTATITEALAALGITFEETPGIKSMLASLPEEQVTKPIVIAEVSARPVSLVKTVIFLNLAELLNSLDSSGVSGISIGELDNWFSPHQPKSAGKPLVLNFRKEVDAALGQSKQGAVALFQGDARATDWQKASRIFILAKLQDDAGEKFVELNVSEPLLTWNPAKFEVALTSKGKEVVANLSNRDGKTLSYFVKGRRGTPQPIESAVSYNEEREKLVARKAAIENQLKQRALDPGKVKATYKALYNDAANPFLSFGAKVAEGLSGNSDESSKRLAEEMKPLLTFKDWLFSRSGEKDASKVDFSEDPTKGKELQKYLSTVISTVENGYMKSQNSDRRTNFATDLSTKALKDGFAQIAKELGKLTIEADAAKQKNWDKYILNVRKLFDKTDQYQQACSSMVDSTGDWQVAAGRPRFEAELNRIAADLQNLQNYKVEDFSLYGEESGTRINFLNQTK